MRRCITVGRRGDSQAGQKKFAAPQDSTGPNSSANLSGAAANGARSLRHVPLALARRTRLRTHLAADPRAPLAERCDGRPVAGSLNASSSAQPCPPDASRIAPSVRVTRPIRILLGDSTDPETAALQQRLRELGTSASAQRLLAEPSFQPGPGLTRRKTAEVTAQLTRSAVDGLVTWSLAHPNVSHPALIDSTVDLLWPGLQATTTIE